MISDDDAQKAVDYLRDTATEAAQNRANRLHLEDYSKSLKALIMQEHTDLPVSAQEREALADDRYIAHLKAVQEAVFLDEKTRFLRDSAGAKIGAWQTMSANERAIRI
jgi:hypothetical protein